MGCTKTGTPYFTVITIMLPQSYFVNKSRPKNVVIFECLPLNFPYVKLFKDSP